MSTLKHEDMIFRKIKREELPEMIQLIRERMAWMDQMGIHHWNKVNYTELYPLSYYEEEYELGEIYVLIRARDDEMISAAVLKEVDDLWPDAPPAYYIHNFVAKLGVKGAGSLFIEKTEKLAGEQRKMYVRLDVLKGSEELAEYYESRGYQVCGTCQDGDYSGILRQKKISMPECT